MSFSDILVIGTSMLIPVLAVLTLREQHLLHAIIGKGMLGIAAAAAYAMMGAPDVAVTEALMGALLVTLLYVVVFSSTGRFRVGYVELSPLVQKGVEGPEGFLIELLRDFGRASGIRPDFIPFDNRESLKGALKNGTMDMAIGPFVHPHDDGRGYLNMPIVETLIYGGGEGEDWRDLLRLLENRGDSADIRKRTPEKAFYSVLVAEDAHDLMDMLSRFIEKNESGYIKRIMDEYLGGRP
jgi:putative multicomponent Na+:H+ antiporter subunit B